MNVIKNRKRKLNTSNQNNTYQPKQKKRKLNNGIINNKHHRNKKRTSIIINDKTNRKCKFRLKRQLIQQDYDDGSYFMKLPISGKTEKRCVLNEMKNEICIQFKEYSEKKNSIYKGLKCRKTVTLTQEQWKFIVKHVDDINT
eukprot:251742_1